MAEEPLPISEAKQVLLAALDEIEKVEREEGAHVKTLVVCWAVRGNGSTVRGWNATDDPEYTITGLLREIANRVEKRVIDEDEEEEEDENA